MNQGKILESQEYLRKVAEAIKKKKLSYSEAIYAGTVNHLEFDRKLGKLLPFKNYTISGVGSAEMFYTMGDTEQRVYEQEIIIPNQTIIKTDSEDRKLLLESPKIYKMENNKIACMQSHKKLFRISDAVGGLAVSHREKRMIMGDVDNYLNDGAQFRMLDWIGDGLPKPVHLTPVDKMALSEFALDKSSLVRESADRFKTWKQIHETVECIAADTMKDNGITF